MDFAEPAVVGVVGPRDPDIIPTIHAKDIHRIRTDKNRIPLPGTTTIAFQTTVKTATTLAIPKTLITGPGMTVGAGISPNTMMTTKSAGTKRSRILTTTITTDIIHPTTLHQGVMVRMGIRMGGEFGQNERLQCYSPFISLLIPELSLESELNLPCPQ